MLSLPGCFAPIFGPSGRFNHNPKERTNHDREAIRDRVRPCPATRRQDRLYVNLQAEIDRLGGVPYGWMKIYETLLFSFYNPRTGQCFPSHKAIAIKARCGVRTVQRALKWSRENNLIRWSHGLVRDGWRVLRTSNRYCFSTFLTIRRIVSSIVASNGQRHRGIPTSTLRKAKNRYNHYSGQQKSLPLRGGPSKLLILNGAERGT
jgi:hypothetical protein